MLDLHFAFAPASISETQNAFVTAAKKEATIENVLLVHIRLYFWNGLGF